MPKRLTLPALCSAVLLVVPAVAVMAQDGRPHDTRRDRERDSGREETERRHADMKRAERDAPSSFYTSRPSSSAAELRARASAEQHGQTLRGAGVTGGTSVNGPGPANAPRPKGGGGGDGRGRDKGRPGGT